MSTLTKLLFIADHGVPTGFARVANGIAGHLHTTGKYDITVMGLGYPGPERSTHPYPYKVVPVMGTGDDPLVFDEFPGWLAANKPDAVFILNDLWNITRYLSMKPRDLPAVGYFPVDTPNMKGVYALGLGGLNQAATYTRFGAMETAAGCREILDTIFRAQRGIQYDTELDWAAFPKGDSKLHIRFDRLAKYQNASSWSVIPHGRDVVSAFEPRDRAEARKLFGIPADAFVVLNVNANQFRKRFDLTLRAFKLLLEKVPHAVLVMHSAGGDRQGWDLRQYAQYLEIPSENMACVHYSNPNLTDDELCWLYNTADVQLNTAGGEGWGLTSMEGAECGIPQVVPDWSATKELWEGKGVLLPVSNYRVETTLLNTIHAEIDIEAAADLLYQLAEQPNTRLKIGAQCRAFALSLPTWPEIGAAFDVLIQRALAEPPANIMTKTEILAAREPGVNSAMAGKALL